MTRPDITSTVTYVTATSDDLEKRTAIVVGYPEGHSATDEVHLAVLTDDGQHLDTLALAVPYSEYARPGHWLPAGVGEWPTQAGDLNGDTQVMETAVG